jgi:GT2 family glycosyltransferase
MPAFERRRRRRAAMLVTRTPRSPSLADLPAPAEGRSGWPWTAADPRLPATMPHGREWPLVTIVTPSFNQGAFLEQTIRSVLLQGYPALEYFVVDAGSTDDSVDILRRYEPWLAGWVSEPDRGQSDAINKGFAQRHGSVCSWLNSDDYLLPGALAEIARSHAAEPAAVAWVGGCQRVSADGTVLNVIAPRGLTRTGLADWSGEGFFYQPACFVASRAIEEAGPLDERLHIAFDLDWWLTMSALGPFVATDRVLAAATIHQDAKTQSRRLHMHAEIIAVQVRHGFIDAAARKLGALMMLAQPTPLVRRLWRLDGPA